MFYIAWRFQNEYGCSILVARCFPLEYFYIIIALAVEIQWHVVGSPPKGPMSVTHSRAITWLGVGGWHLPTLHLYAPNDHHGG